MTIIISFVYYLSKKTFLLKMVCFYILFFFLNNNSRDCLFIFSCSMNKHYNCYYN